jgi:hypothetical protein
MEPIHGARLPADPATSPDAATLALREVDAAIELVAHGLASRVRLTGLADLPGVQATALARTQAAGLGFHIDRTGTSPGLTIGPRR